MCIVCVLQVAKTEFDDWDELFTFLEITAHDELEKMNHAKKNATKRPTLYHYRAVGLRQSRWGDGHKMSARQEHAHGCASRALHLHMVKIRKKCGKAVLPKGVPSVRSHHNKNK